MRRGVPWDGPLSHQSGASDNFFERAGFQLWLAQQLCVCGNQKALSQLCDIDQSRHGVSAK